MSDPVDEAAACLALGRIFGMMQRPSRPGDVDEYERMRGVFMDAAAPAGFPRDPRFHAQTALHRPPAHPSVYDAPKRRKRRG